MKKRILSTAISLVLCLMLFPIGAEAQDGISVTTPQQLSEITIEFQKNGRDYEMTFTDVSSIVITETVGNQTYPYTIFYYPGATVSVSRAMDNSADFTNGFFLEANYHFGSNGQVAANTVYSIEDVFARLFTILNGDTYDVSEGTGVVGLGPIFLVPWSPDALSWYRESDVALISAFQKGGNADLPSAWAQDLVSVAIAAGIVPENLQQNYTEAVSRGEVAEMFIRLLEKSSGKDIDAILAEKGVQINPTAFTDTTDKNVLAANALGIINGVGNNRFDPNGTFTRAQIAVILNRTAEVLGVETDGYTHAFTDVSGHWCNTELGWPVHAGIINGVGNNRFDPDGVLTTEQSIVMAQRALEALTAISADFDWVSLEVTYNNNLRPYAESLGFDCEYSSAGSILGDTEYWLYFTKNDIRVGVFPLPASECFNYWIGKPDDSVRILRIEGDVELLHCTSTHDIKTVLASIAS